MNQARVDQLIQFAVLAAARNDDWDERELGPIHLLKYVYLADLAFAERNDGQTFTGAPWKFHHFGPWATEVFQRLEPALADIEATRKVIPSNYDKDTIRWSKSDDRLFDRLDGELPHIVASAIRRSVKKYAAHTGDLLHHVYKTGPMLKAAPGELLQFPSGVLAVRDPAGAEPAPISKKQEKKRKERMRAFKQDFQKRLAVAAAERTARSEQGASPPPRYDEVFYEGTAWLDSLAGDPPNEGRVELSFDESVWKSDVRGEDRG